MDIDWIESAWIERINFSYYKKSLFKSKNIQSFNKCSLIIYSVVLPCVWHLEYKDTNILIV
jgi:hypothetical protein